MRFNELMETVDLGLYLLYALIDSTVCVGVTALHEAVTPRRPACKVIYIQLLGKYQGVET